jgi:hypothetical protein
MKKSAEEKPAAVGSWKVRVNAQHDGASAREPLLGLQQSAGNQAMLGLLSGGAVLQRKAKGDDAETGANEGAQSAANQKQVAAGLIVEDDAQEVKPGQMRKSTMWSVMGCPYTDRWLDHYSKQPGAYMERARCLSTYGKRRVYKAPPSTFHWSNSVCGAG